MSTVIDDTKAVETNFASRTSDLKSQEGQIISAPKGASQKSSPLIKNVALSILGMAALGGGVLWWMHASSIEETDDAFITGHVHQLSSRVSGTVLKVAVDDNQHVKQGQVLVNIDPRDYQISAESAKAALEKAKWQAVEAQTTIVGNERQADAQKFQAESAVASAQAQINKAQEALSNARVGVTITRTQIQQREAELTRATSDYVRYNDLLRDRAVTTQSFEKAKQDKEVAEANLAASQATLDQSILNVKEAQQALADTKTNAVRAMGNIQSAAAARAQTETSKRTVNVQQSAANQAKAEYENKLIQLSYTNVVAPVSGKIGHKTVEVGQQIERGQALMSIISDEKWVVANFKETQLGRMQVGQSVDIKIDSFEGKHFKGRVESMSPASGAQFSMLPPDNASGNFTKVVQRVAVKVVFDPESIRDYASRLTPGMSVICEVSVKH